MLCDCCPMALIQTSSHSDSPIFGSTFLMKASMIGLTEPNDAENHGEGEQNRASEEDLQLGQPVV